MAEERESRVIGSKIIEEAQAKRGRTFHPRNPADFLAVAIATSLGVGFVPFASGTFGSVVGLAIFYGLNAALRVRPDRLQNSILALSVILAVIGTWAATRSEKVFGKKDAGQIVIDEVCGQLISFAFVSVFFMKTSSPLVLLVGFFLFRFFDIFKPYPIRRLEGLGSGLGVMADDILAGIYAAVVLSLILQFAPYPF